MNADWTVGGISFAYLAGAFTLGSTGGYTLTMNGTGGWLNAAEISTSTNVPETIDVPITMVSDLLVSSYSANLGFNQPIDNGGYNLMTNYRSHSASRAASAAAAASPRPPSTTRSR